MVKYHKCWIEKVPTEGYIQYDTMYIVLKHKIILYIII